MRRLTRIVLVTLVPLALLTCRSADAPERHERRPHASGSTAPEAQDPRTKPFPSGSAPRAAAPSAKHDASPGAPRTLREEDLRGLAWRSVGPANMGGRVSAIAIEPGNAKTYYVGCGTGGLWKTTNAGTTFSPLFDEEATSSIGSIAVADAPPDWPGWKDEPEDPRAHQTDVRELDAELSKLHEDLRGYRDQHPKYKQLLISIQQLEKRRDQLTRLGSADEEKDKGKGKIVWVGTGEGNGRNSSSWGRGMYRSTDAGSKFEHVGLADAHDIPSLAVDPKNPDVCYAAALGHLWGPNQERGVYKTADGGKTWKAVLQIDENTGACDVRVDPAQPSTVYAAMYMRRRTPYSFMSGGKEGGIYRSDDAGATWKKLAQGLPAETGRIGLDLYAADPRIVYAVVESNLGGRLGEPFEDKSRAGGVFRSEDRGESWTRVNAYTPRAFYFSRVRVDPENDQRVYVLGWQIWVSDDGGQNLRAGGARKPHVDYHAMVIDPNDTDHLIAGNDGGIYVSHDGSKTWDFLNHLALGQFYNVAVDGSDPYRIGGGLQDNGSWIGPSANIYEITTMENGGKSPGAILNHHWQFVNNGDGFHVAFDPFDRNIVYAESQGGELVRIHLDTGVRRMIKPSPKEGERRFRFNWNSPFFVSPHAKAGESPALYMGGNYVFRLLDRGDRWERISNDLSQSIVDRIDTVGSDAETHGTVVSLAESPLAAGTLWAGTDDGLVHVTRDGGGSWQNVTPAQVGGHYVSRIEASHHDAQTAYVSIDGHRSDVMTPNVVVTHDGGQSWQSIAGDLPADAPVKVIREDPQNAQVLYAGTETSAFVSIDAGAQWVRMNAKSLPTVPVDDIVVHPSEHDLVAGTHGRSIYVLDDAAALAELSQEVLDSSLHLFAIPTAKPRLFLPLDGIWTDRVFVAKNPDMGARITYWLRDYTGDEVKIKVTDANGTTVREITGTNRPGLNRAVWDLQREEYDRLPDPDSRLEQKQFVPAGDYHVTVSAGKESAQGTVTVERAPGASPNG